ncbi:hypothetical protein ACL9RF_00220 [Sphingobacterium sp. Mn56C]|uniref:hypothetical protein n=1 Tax=Sphingobacterium sp. Mn56C TaxID=3395261 RepID=UPI003BC3A37D
MKRKQNFIERNMAEIKNTLFPENEQDSTLRKNAKKFGWVMFLLLMLCSTITMLIAVSFAH